MNIYDFLTLFGGLAMFLYGMRLMGDSLKESSSGTLKVAMEQVTNNPVKAFVLGMLITALIQSSTATIVITSGLVGAGILTLHQSLGIIVGANVGTTITGQIIRLLDIDASAGSILRLFQPSSLAPMALIIGILLLMGGRFKNAKSIGNILIGFGVLFSGLLNMTSAVNALAASGIVERLFAGLGSNPVIGYLTGAGVAFVLQSSSATIGILQAFSSAGVLTWKAIYALIVGIYLGDCVTTFIVCAIGADPDAKRVGIVNILFNLSKTVGVLAVVTIVHRMGLLDWIWDTTVNSGIIANTNSIFNLACAVTMFPLLGTYEKLSRKIAKDAPVSEDKYKDKLDSLNPVFVNTPALALRSCYDVLMTIFYVAAANIQKSRMLMEEYDERVYVDIREEEQNINRLTDGVSRYLVELLPHLQDPVHVRILDQYYKVTGEFEHLGDIAANMADNIRELHQKDYRYSEEAYREISVVNELLDRVLEKTELAFRKRDVQAAYDIEPLAEAVEDLLGQMKRNHLKRMGSGICSVYADASYTNLMAEMQKMADTCSNVGVATVIRVRPELADHEHNYFKAMHSGNDEEFNTAYQIVRKEFMEKLAG